MSDIHEVTASGRSTRVKMVGVREGAVRQSRARMALAASVFALCFLTLGGKLVWLASQNASGEPVAEKPPVNRTASFERADIVDRNGYVLATDLVTQSLYANPKQIFDPREAARKLTKVLPEVSEEELLRRLSVEREFIWLKRNLTPAQHAAVYDLAIPGIWFQPEQRRIYPQGQLASHILGFTDIDRKGIAGVEQYFDASLRQKARYGDDLALAVDVRVQYALRDELRAAMDKFSAIGAAGVVLDVNSGEVVAMSSLPDFDPNHPTDSPVTARFNRATKGVYELGSVFKAFTVALALDTGTVDISGGYDATKPIKISRFTIRDDHPKKRWLSVPEIFMYSSNIGAAKMAIDVGGVRQQEFMRRLGLLNRAKLELPELGSPLKPARWRDINTMTISFGHGLAVSPLQLATSMGAVVNGGVLVPPTLLKKAADAPVLGERVLSEGTSKAMRSLLRLVVSEGTGKSANVKGYLVGGKTGTAEKPGVRGYRRRALLSSFVAAFPMDAPRYVVYAVLDEPQGIKETHGFASAGWTAAPTAGRIVRRIAPILGVNPVAGRNEEIANAQLNVATLQKGGTRLASFKPD